jgi:putative RecB family exonuclease
MSLTLPSTLTPSKISAFTSCPLSFRFSVVERLPEVPSIHAVRGTLVHRALQLLFEEHARGSRDRPAAETCLATAFGEMQSGDELTDLALSDEGAAELRREASVLLDRYFELEEPNGVEVVATELDLSAEVSGMTLRGIIDRLDRCENGGLAVVDYKTGRAPRLEQSRSRLSALQLYAFLCELVVGERPAVVRLMYLRDRVVVSSDTTDQSLRGVQLRARAVWTAIERACERTDFRPNPSPLCKWCSFQAYCPVFGGDPERASEEMTPVVVRRRPAAPIPA